MRLKSYKGYFIIFVCILIIIIVVMILDDKNSKQEQKEKNLKYATEFAEERERSFSQYSKYGGYRDNYYVPFDNKLKFLFYHTEVKNVNKKSGYKKAVLFYFTLENTSKESYNLKNIEHSCYNPNGIEVKDVSKYYNDSLGDMGKLRKDSECEGFIAYGYDGDGEYIVELEQDSGELIEVKIDVEK